MIKKEQIVANVEAKRESDFEKKKRKKERKKRSKKWILAIVEAKREWDFEKKRKEKDDEKNEYSWMSKLSVNQILKKKEEKKGKNRTIKNNKWILVNVEAKREWDFNKKENEKNTIKNEYSRLSRECEWDFEKKEKQRTRLVFEIVNKA